MRFATLALVLVGCMGHLEPAPAAERAGPDTAAASNADADVHVEARMNAWSGDPQSLADQFTPVLVRVQNDGARPIDLKYEYATLETEKGRLYARAPMKLTGTISNPPRSLDSFEARPCLDPLDPGFDPWTGRWCDPHYYDMRFPSDKAVDLPTSDMLAAALPEGILRTGDSAVGFLYFDRTTAENVTFRLKLVDARNGDDLGTVDVPFVRAPASVAER